MRTANVYVRASIARGAQQAAISAFCPLHSHEIKTEFRDLENGIRTTPTPETDREPPLESDLRHYPH